jgi:omega-6 fatty acid desaturase (delta-12 desaturase)
VSQPSIAPLTRTSSASVSRPDIVETSTRYRQGVLTALSSGGWGRDLEDTAHAAVQRLRRARRVSLAPHAGRAALAAARTMLFVAAPLVAADRLWDSGWSWAAAPLVLLAGMALYGVVAIVHDMAHGSFVPSKRINAITGHLLAPFVLMEFGGFRRSHLDHHRHSQSTIDPKRFGVTHDEGTTAPEHCTLDHTPVLLRAPARFGAWAVRLPLRVRQFGYLCISPIFMGPAVLLFSGEFSVARRDWRRVESWAATALSAAYIAALYAWSPRLLVLFLIALIIGHSFTFYVFAAHLGPNQVYWTSARRAAVADSLNVSDIHCGKLLRWLGLGLSDYHSTHHLSPAIPSYHLPAAEAMVAPDLAPLRAPAIDLLEPASCALLFDSFFRGVVRPNAESWDYVDAGGMRRPATPEADR